MSRKQEWTALRSRLTEVLSQFGPNANEGGDYYIVEEDSGTYELKVKTFARFLLPPELVEEICEVLEDYSSKWSVSLVQVHNDGTDVTPVGGAKISALGGVEMIPPGEYSPEEVSELEGLYDSLEKLLGARGTSDPFGNGDYWIVDDGWVRHSHKVCIFNIGFLSPELTADVQRLLRRDFPGCVVWFQIEVIEPGIEVPLPGMRVFADRVEQDWDRDLLRSIFQEPFRW